MIAPGMFMFESYAHLIYVYCTLLYLYAYILLRYVMQLVRQQGLQAHGKSLQESCMHMQILECRGVFEHPRSPDISWVDGWNLE
mgnify:CR=1 FL=1